MKGSSLATAMAIIWLKGGMTMTTTRLPVRPKYTELTHEELLELNHNPHDPFTKAVHEEITRLIKFYLNDLDYYIEQPVGSAIEDLSLKFAQREYNITNNVVKYSPYPNLRKPKEPS